MRTRLGNPAVRMEDIVSRLEAREGPPAADRIPAGIGGPGAETTAPARRQFSSASRWAPTSSSASAMAARKLARISSPPSTLLANQS